MHVNYVTHILPTRAFMIVNYMTSKDIVFFTKVLSKLVDVLKRPRSDGAMISKHFIIIIIIITTIIIIIIIIIIFF